MEQLIHQLRKKQKQREGEGGMEGERARGKGARKLGRQREINIKFL